MRIEMNWPLRLIGKAIGLCSVASLLPIQAPCQSTAISLSAGPGTVGGTIVVSVSLPAGSAALASLQWDLTYTASELAPISCTYYATGAAATAAGKSAICTSLSAGAVRCLIVGLNATALSNGVLATITLQIGSGVNDSASPIDA